MRAAKSFGLCVVWLGALCAAPALAQQAPIPIEVSLGDVSLNKVPFLVAADEGIYAKHGLAVHQYITPYAADKARHQGITVPDEYVKDDTLDDAHIAVGGGTPMIVRTVRDARATDRVIIATFENRVRDHIIAGPNIRTLEDIRGRRLGFSGDGAVTHLAAVAFVRMMGWNEQYDVSMIGNANAPFAILEGKVDAFVGSALVQSLALQQNLTDLVDMSQWEIPIAGSGLNAERNWLRENREAARRFVMASIEVTALIKEDKQSFIDAMVKWFNITDEETQDIMYDHALDLPRVPYPAVDGIVKTMEVYDFREMHRRQPSDFYDDSIVRELEQSGFIAALYE